MTTARINSLFLVLLGNEHMPTARINSFYLGTSI